MTVHRWGIYYYPDPREPLEPPADLEHRWVDVFGTDCLVVYGDSRADWLAVPNRGVIAVAVANARSGQRVWAGQGGDDYLYNPTTDEPQGANLGALLDHLLLERAMTPEQALCDVPPAALFAAGVKFGRYAPDPAYEALYVLAREDPRLPERSAKHARER